MVSVSVAANGTLSELDKKKEFLLENLSNGETKGDPLRNAMDRTPAQAGFNIEGGAINGKGEFLVGLRSPTVTLSGTFKRGEERLSNEAALILTLDKSTSPWTLRRRSQLTLDGDGVRGMCYDAKRKGTWILGGISADPQDHSVAKRWSLWFWPDTMSGLGPHLPEEYELKDHYGLANAEAICLVTKPGTEEQWLLVMEDRDSDKSKYVMFRPRTP